MRLLQHIKGWINSHYGTTVTVVIVVLTLWQLVVASFGIDLCDSGYYLTFFDNIFKAPALTAVNLVRPPEKHKVYAGQENA